MPTLTGLTAVITGASSGIGASLARDVSRAGARVVLVARRLDRLEQIATDCPGEKLIISGDLMLEEDRRAIVSQTMDVFGSIDLLFNNAGKGAYGDFLETTEDEWRNLFEINVFAPVLLTRLVIPVMIEQGRGTIVNIASIGGLIAHSNRVTPYVASKHALIGFTRGLAKDLAHTGIKVHAACPHLTDTEFFDVSTGSEKMAGLVENYRSYMDSPAEVAHGILNGLDYEDLVIFPTDKPAKAFKKQRDIQYA
jgi:short-subunit dehydrogenase